MKKDSLSVICLDDFLDKDSLRGLQEKMLSVDYSVATNAEYGEDGKKEEKNKFHHGYEHQFAVDHFKDDLILKKIKDEFFLHDDLKPVEIRAHLKHNTKEPHAHRDGKGDKEVWSFLLYVKGEQLLYNGTAFYGQDSKLNTYVGFQENRALLFNSGKIYHTDLQALGQSSPRYSLNIFYKAPFE